jgi:hypothetical protein
MEPIFTAVLANACTGQTTVAVASSFLFNTLILSSYLCLIFHLLSSLEVSQPAFLIFYNMLTRAFMERYLNLPGK